MSSLFKPIVYGSVEASNRVVLAPLTRNRATKDCVPTEIMAQYYGQRANFGLILTEATVISKEALGWPYSPGIWTQEQVDHWKLVTSTVHKNGGKIFVQLWHMGRIVHSSLSGMQPVAPSPIAIKENVRSYEGRQISEVPRELTKEDIKRIVGDFRKAASNAIDAGFDGVLVHGANGYLVHQFLSDSSNKRTDEYGGSIENRVRFLAEVVDAITEDIGADKTAVHLSPNGEIMSCVDSDPEPLYTAVAKLLNDKKIAFISMRESSPEAWFAPSDVPPLHSVFRKHFKGPLILNQNYTKETAEKAIDEGIADAIAFGRLSISNPDLATKFKNGIPPKIVDDSKYYYTFGPKGYSELD